MIKTRWKIYTEYVHSRHIAEIVGKYFDDFSMFSGIGHYGGEKERCLVIEIITEHNREEDIISICREINTVNHQECTLITNERIETLLISERK